MNRTTRGARHSRTRAVCAIGALALVALILILLIHVTETLGSYHGSTYALLRQAIVELRALLARR